MAKSWETPKDPDEIRDYGVNWEADIGDNTISSSAWSVVTGAVVIDADSNTDTTTTARLSGGEIGETAELLNHVVLSNGEECEITCKLKIKAK